MNIKNNNTVECSFCNAKTNSSQLVVMRSGLICAQCVKRCAELINQEQGNREQPQLIPSALKAVLDQHVIGQDKAKKCLAVAVYNHYKRHLNPDGVVIDKSNVLMVGPTGTGKTLLVKSLAKSLNVPIALNDATSLTGAGYVGEDVESVLLRLLRAANNDLELAQRGIVYIDEIDKLAPKGGKSSQSVTRDCVATTDVQEGLLKILEGSKVSVPLVGGRRHPQQETIEMDTTNILFICSGAFDGINDIVKRRLGGESIGFTKVVKKPETGRIIREDLVEYGLIPEFIGRFSAIVELEKLTKEEMLQILTEPKNSILNQYSKLFALDSTNLEFTPDALEEIVNLAMRSNSGARDLRGILEDALTELMFTAPDKKQDSIVIDKPFLLEALKERFVFD